MRKIEIAKWALLYAFNDCIDDMDEYYLYFMIPLSKYGGCDGLDSVFSTLLFAKGIANIINKPVSGWITDALENHQHLTLLASCIGLLVTGALFLFAGHLVTVPALVAFYVLHQCALSLNENSTWKCIKYRVQLLYGSENTEKQNETTGYIGVSGEIFSDVYETVWLIVIWAVSVHASFEYARWLMLASCFIAYVASTLVALTITRRSFYSKGEEFGRDVLDDSRNEAEEALLLEGSIQHHDEAEYPTSSNPVVRFFQSVAIFFKKAFRALWTSKLALHVILMSLTLYAFNELFEYPITFAESTSSSSGSDSDSGSVGNYCHSTLQNMTEEAAIDNSFYTGGALLYLIFLVKMPSLFFFNVAFPGVVAITIFMSLPLLIFGDVLAKTPAYIITGIVLVIPYYLERYLLYFWSSIVDEKHYGFFYGIYALGQQVIHLPTSRLLDNLEGVTTSSPIFTGLLAFCIILIGVDYFYSLWIVYAYRTFFDHKGWSAPEGHH